MIGINIIFDDDTPYNKSMGYPYLDSYNSFIIILNCTNFRPTVSWGRQPIPA